MKVKRAEFQQKIRMEQMGKRVWRILFFITWLGIIANWLGR